MVEIKLFSFVSEGSYVADQTGNCLKMRGQYCLQGIHGALAKRRK